MELGLYAFAERTPDLSGHTISPHQRLRDLIEVTEKILLQHEIFGQLPPVPRPVMHGALEPVLS